MANVKLTAHEMATVLDSDFILTKNHILTQVRGMFATLAAAYQSYVSTEQNRLPEIIFATGPKISRGEQFRGLPYVILDYPRVFGKEDMAAVRTFFWWGHFFSISLLLSGCYKDEWGNGFWVNDLADWDIDLSASPWNHDHISGHTIRSFPKDKLKGLAFLKITKRIPLTEWDSAPATLERAFIAIGEIFAQRKGSL